MPMGCYALAISPTRKMPRSWDKGEPGMMWLLLGIKEWLSALLQQPLWGQRKEIGFPSLPSYPSRDLHRSLALGIFDGTHLRIGIQCSVS